MTLAILLNGTALPAAVAASTAGDTGMHSGHADHDGATGDSAGSAPMSDFPMDCCDGGACGCGCFMPATATLPAVQPAEYPTSSVNVSFADSLHDLSATGAPFRPPA